MLVTHGVGYLPQVDRIFVLKEGRITEKGTYRELLRRQGEFAEFLIQYLTEEEHQHQEGGGGGGGEAGAGDSESEQLEEIKQELEATMGREQFQRRISQARSATGKTSLSSLVRVAVKKGWYCSQHF